MPVKWDWSLNLPSGSFMFGDNSSDWVVERWDASASPLRTDDHQVPRGDGVLMGQDFKDAPTLTFDLWSHVADESAARDALGVLMRSWDAPDVRGRGGQVVELAHPRGRSVFGRPRQIAPSNVNRIERGRVEVTAAFDVSYDCWFGASGGAELSLVPPLGRGLVAPLVEPLTIQGAAQNASGFTVGGVVPTYPVITFRGPVTNPEIDAGVWHLKIRGSLAYDETLVVDTRPWKRSLSLNGRPVAGMLMPTSSRLRDCILAPGTYSARLRGVDATGTATASVSWREAYASF